MATFLKKNLHYLFDLIGGLLFAVVMYGVVIRNYKLDHITPLITLGIVLAFILLQKLIDKLPSKGFAYWCIMAFVFLIMLAWHIAAAYLLELELIGGDARVVMSSSMYLVAGEESPATKDMFYNAAYFAQYQNQFGYLILLLGVAKLGMLLTGHVSFAQFVVFNLIMIEISVVMTIICAEKLGRKREISSCGLRVMVILALAPFLWLMVPYAYTDSFSLPFIMGTVLLSMYGIDHIQSDKGVLLFQEKNYGDVLRFFAIGVFIAMGYKVKGNMIILLVALIMVLFVRLPLRKWCETCAGLLLGFVSFVIIFGIILNSTGLLTKENSDRYKFPITHWIMMGMDSFGASTEDVMYTKSFTSYQEKKEAVLRRMKEKYERMGLDGLLDHYYKKATRDSWDSGSFSMDLLLNLSSGSIVPKRPGILHEYVTRAGTYHDRFRPWANGYWNALEILALIGFFSLNRKKGMSELTMLRLSITGTILFFMIWEANWKYIFCSTLFISILSAFEMESLSHIALPVQGKKKGAEMAQKLLAGLTESVDEAVREQIAQHRYAPAERLVRFYRRLGETIAYGSAYENPITAKAEEMRRMLDDGKSRERVVENVMFYLDLWKRPEEIALKQLPNVIATGIQLRCKLEALKRDMGEAGLDGLIRELESRLRYMQSLMPNPRKADAEENPCQIYNHKRDV